MNVCFLKIVCLVSCLFHFLNILFNFQRTYFSSNLSFFLKAWLYIGHHVTWLVVWLRTSCLIAGMIFVIANLPLIVFHLKLPTMSADKEWMMDMNDEY